MRLSHLRQALASLPSHLSGWTETTIESLYWNGVYIVAEGDTSETESLREQLKQNEKDAEEQSRDIKDAVERAEKAEEEAAKLREEMAALKDPSEDGESVATYRQRAIDAEEETAKWLEHVREAGQRVEEMAKELAAMRKRKGVEPGFMAHTFEAMGFLNTIMHYGDPDKARWNERAADTLVRLARDAKRLAEKIRATANAGTAKRAA